MSEHYDDLRRFYVPAAMKVSDTLSHRAVGAADVPASVGGVGCCPGANVCCADGFTCCEGQTRCCANCCANDVCCDSACNECVDNGFLAGGTITVDPNPACIGDTITFGNRHGNGTHIGE